MQRYSHYHLKTQLPVMPDTGSSFSNASVPFVLRGSSSVFSRRQIDTFGSLQALEDAHNKVTKATKAERLLIKRMTWRPAKPAVESLEAEKEARDRQNVSGGDSKSLFKVPTVPPPRASKRRGGSGMCGVSRFLEVPRRDPSKWTHYSLADTAEDAGLGAHANRKIAADLMRELRRQREEREGKIEDIPPSVDDTQSGRILFHPMSGKKRTRFDQSGAILPPATVNPKVFEEDEEGEEGSQNENNHEGFCKESATPEVVAFRTRIQQGRQCFGRLSASTSKDSDEEIDLNESASISSATLDSDNSSDSATDANDIDDAEMEDGPEVIVGTFDCSAVSSVMLSCDYYNCLGNSSLLFVTKDDPCPDD
ncbi:hypothetical protein TcWFU_001811 [Taenia crassiceps]|uniref:Protein TSSC4 n=1 Tax=Taenia crassiceps TaxID=6207 RepID=A0ABR4Q038_9CEST